MGKDYEPVYVPSLMKTGDVRGLTGYCEIA